MSTDRVLYNPITYIVFSQETNADLQLAMRARADWNVVWGREHTSWFPRGNIAYHIRPTVSAYLAYRAHGSSDLLARPILDTTGWRNSLHIGFVHTFMLSVQEIETWSRILGQAFRCESRKCTQGCEN